MHEYFKGWRKKAGIVVLASSLAFMGMWLRSISETDIITIPIARLPLVIMISRGGSFALTWADSSPNHAFPGWTSSSQYISLADCGYLFDFSGDKRDWRGLNLLSTTIVSFQVSPQELASLGAAEEAEPSDDQSSDETAAQPDTIPLETTATVTAPVVIQNNLNVAGQPSFQPLPQNASGTLVTVPSTTGIILTGAPTAPAGVATYSFVFQPPSGATPFSLWAIPYWAVVTCLTLLSAYLLLSKHSAVKRV